MARLLAAPDDTDDVVQTVLLKLQSPDALRRMRASGSPGGYATVMVRNAAVDAIRRRATAAPQGEPPTTFEAPDEALDARARQAAVVDLLDSLAASDRLLLRLRFWEDLSIADIAGRLGMPYSTIAVRLFRLLRRLRSQMGADDEGLPN
jgi:RNA polymerase sigma-70 factor (ECF subfamily)